MRRRLFEAIPRTILTNAPGSVRFVYTDGACEPGDNLRCCSIGGVLYACEGGVWSTRYFSCRLPDDLVSSWAEMGKAHLIGPTEMVAVVVARSVWAKWLDSQRSIYFIDHSGVLASAIKGASRDALWRRLLVMLESADAVPSLAWYSRVPSASNPADPPSRGSSEFPRKGATFRDYPLNPFDSRPLPNLC